MAADHLCLLRGGGDLATGVAWRLTRAGFPVVVCELDNPLTVRCTVALSTAIHDGRVSVEGMVGRRARTADEAVHIAFSGDVGVVVAPDLPDISAQVVVDARLAKRNINTSLTDAPLVVALGPGFRAGMDCHAVVETMRGPRLGRLMWEGEAEADTGTPGLVGGRGSERVLRAPAAGEITWTRAIGDVVEAGELLGEVDGSALTAPFDGIVRGLIKPGQVVPVGLKVGDVDPRIDARVDEISDKALAIGGAAVEAVMTWSNQLR